MKDERFMQIMADLGMPDSHSLLGALQQVANEVAQEREAKHIVDTGTLRDRVAALEAQGGLAWVNVDTRLPPDETHVLVLRNGVLHTGARFWDHPGHEDTYQSYWYWDDPNNEGRDWQNDQITHWMPAPPLPFP
jgi:hypothetical protein